MAIYIKYSLPLGGFIMEEVESISEAEEDMLNVVEEYERLGIKDNGTIEVRG